MKITLSVLSLLALLLSTGCQNTPAEAKQAQADQKAMNQADAEYQLNNNSGSGTIDAPSDENPLGLGAQDTM